MEAVKQDGVVLQYGSRSDTEGVVLAMLSFRSDLLKGSFMLDIHTLV